jgi:hypothetical protein
MNFSRMPQDLHGAIRFSADHSAAGLARNGNGRNLNEQQSTDFGVLADAS